MTCNICKGKGYFHIDEVQSRETIREYYHCPKCNPNNEMGIKLSDWVIASDNRLSWEERHDVVTMRDW